MTNINATLNLTAAELLEVNHIRGVWPDMMQRYTNLEVRLLWKAFSAEYCASWLVVNTENIANFSKWLDE